MDKYFSKDIDNFINIYNIDESKLLDIKYKYLKYQKEPMIIYSNKEFITITIIKFLEQIGLSLNEIGTFLYSDIIFKLIIILEYLDNTEFFFNDYYKLTNLNNINLELKEKLLESLKDPYSYFYSSLAIEKNKINLTTFHNYIEKSFNNINKEKYKDTIASLTNNNLDNLSYEQLAIIIAFYLQEHKVLANTSNNKIKKLKD